MKKIKILDLDQLMYYLAEKADDLDVCGYDVRYIGLDFNGRKSLFKWFVDHLKEIKAGVDNLLIAEAIGESEWQYAGDNIRITSIPAKDENFILIILKTMKAYYIDGQFKTETIEDAVLFKTADQEY